MNKAFEKILEKIEEKVIPVLDEDEHVVPESNIKEPYEIEMVTLSDVKKIVQEVAEEYNGGWIPVKTRQMTEEEKEYYSEYLFEGNGLIYECPLPDDGQEVLITSKYGSVDKTTFYTDCGNYFENYEDYDEVIAWQPLPEPYKERD